MTNLSKIPLESLPFLSIGIHDGVEYIGIIGNCDKQITSIYVLSEIMTQEEKNEFLDTCEEWWWETNRQIPINISLKSKWRKFKHLLKNFNTKDFTLLSGPSTSLDNMINKRIKRKQILIKKIQDK